VPQGISQTSTQSSEATTVSGDEGDGSLPAKTSPNLNIFTPVAPGAGRLTAGQVDLAIVEDSATQRQLTLLNQLAALVALRSKAQECAERERGQTLRTADADHEQAQRAAAALHEKVIKATEQAYRTQLAVLTTRSENEVKQAEEQRRKALHQQLAETNQLEAKANERLDEKTWLADTMLESTAKKAKQDFDAAATQLKQREQDITNATAQASAMLASGRFAPLPHAQPHTAGIDERVLVPATELAESAAETARALSLTQTLEVRSTPMLLNTGFVMGSVLGATAIGAIVGSVLGATAREAGQETVKQIAIFGASAGGGAILLFLILRFVLRARVAPVAGQLAASLAQAAWINDRALKAVTLAREAVLRDAKRKRDEELIAATQQEKSSLLRITHRREVDEPAMRSSLDNTLTRLHAAHAAALVALEKSVAAKRAAADQQRDATTNAAQESSSTQRHQAAQNFQKSQEQTSSDWSYGLGSIDAERAVIDSAAMAGCESWESLTATSFVPPVEVPLTVRLGSYTVAPSQLPGGIPPDEILHGEFAQRFPRGEFSLPLTLDFEARASLLISYTPQQREAAISTLNNAMMRLITALPPSKVRFTILDPVGLGQSFSAFSHLADADEKLINDRVWTQAKHIEQKLTDLTEHMETVIQKYLRNEFATIQEYNAQAGEVAEPLRFLVIADFPANISEQSAKRLASIVTSGPRCGVFTLIAHDASVRAPAWLPLGELQRASLWLRWDQQSARFVRQDHPLFAAWPISLEVPPPESLTTALLKRVGELSKELGRVRVPFNIITPSDPSQVWSLRSSDEIRVPLGRAGATKLQYLTLGRGTAQHALIAGRTGSGKSTLLHVIVTNLALWYSPDEIEMYLIDFKKGVEFKAYAQHRLPHAKVIAIESEREFGLSVLRRLDQELTRRGQHFRECNVQDVASFRSKNPGIALPRVLLLVDEFQEFFVEDDKLSQEAALLLDRLVRQGRAFGMHVVLGSQTLGGAYSLARSTLGQMAVRIALQCSEADSYLIMSEDNAAPRLLSRPGEAIYNDASGMIEGNNPFQIVWLPEETRERSLASIRSKPLTPGGPPVDQNWNAIVFEGNQPADIERNLRLRALEAAPKAGMNALLPVQVWLGDAVSIKDPTAMLFRRQSASNLLIVGQQEESALSMMFAAVRSIAAHADQQPSIVVLDSTPADSTDYEALGAYTAKLIGEQNISIRTAGPRGAAAAIDTIAEEVARREADGRADQPPIFIVIMGLHRFRDLRKQDDYSFGADADAPKPDKQLAKVLRDGPAFGVHVIAWCDTAASLDRTLERQTAREFEARVLFQMSANDSTNLIDAPSAATLGRNRALLYREELGTIEKFRPYAAADR